MNTCLTSIICTETSSISIDYMVDNIGGIMDKIINTPYDILVISGFSGSGKGTIINKLLSLHPELDLIKSYTTRRKRNSADYYSFIDLKEFTSLKKKEDFFLEVNRYSGEWYGTPVHLVKNCISSGKTAIIEVDPNGFKQIVTSPLAKGMRILSVFVTVDADTLVKRIFSRNTENLDKILLRLNASLNECEWVNSYDIALPNYDLDESVKQIEKALFNYIYPHTSFDTEKFKHRMEEIVDILSD